ncbi:hypothetical protein HLB25_10225, partial [Dickeya dadantii]|nr:hypothetical protein [Dickeya dadantii]
MKAQKYPASIIKKGAILYRAFGWIDDDDGKVHLDMEEWHVRSIQKRKISRYSEIKKTAISLVQKVDYVTWVKSNWTNNFPSYYRLKFYQGDDLPGGVYTTKNKALLYALELHLNSSKWYEKERDSGRW